LTKHGRLVDEADHRFDSFDTAIVTNSGNRLEPCVLDRCVLGGKVLAEIASEVSMMTEQPPCSRNRVRWFESGLHLLDLSQVRFWKDPVSLKETSVLCHEGSKRIPDFRHVVSRDGISIQIGESGKDRFVRFFRNISE
jgi:hypothetical protein